MPLAVSIEVYCAVYLLIGVKCTFLIILNHVVLKIVNT